MTERELKSPITVTLARITDLNDPRLEEALEVTREAFQSDPMARVMVGGHDSLRKYVHAGIGNAAVVGGFFCVALDTEGKVLGTASWFPAGHDFGLDEKQASGIAVLLGKIEEEQPLLHNWWMTTLFPWQAEVPTKAYKAAGFTEKNFRLSNYILYAYAVKPAMQGRGIGKKLLQTFEEQAAAEGCSVGLETADDGANDSWQVRWYEKLGYQRIHTGELPGMAGDLGRCRMHVLVKTPKLTS